MTKRTAINEPAKQACPHCPWRKSNQGKRHSLGWYTKSNLRRLWAGLRAGDAPGMTCHPTDPDNPLPEGAEPLPEGVETRECYGASLMIARELNVIGRLDAQGAGFKLFSKYKECRPKGGLTRAGAAYWSMRAVMPSNPLIGRKLSTTYYEDADIGHPDFESPLLTDGTQPNE